MVVGVRDAGHVAQYGELDRWGPGSHVCCVVDSAAEFEAWTADCLADGVVHGEKLFRFAPHASLKSAPADAAVTWADPHVAFLGRGPVDPQVMYAMFRRETEAARREGYRGLRLVADMDWLLSCPPSRAELADFELRLDEVVRELGATVVCAYRTGHFDADTIAEMVAVHPATVGAVPADPGLRMWNVAGGVWEVTGEIDTLNVEVFERALASMSRGASLLRLRASGLQFIAVDGIQALVRLVRSRPDLRVIVEDASLAFRRCWTLFDLDLLLPMVEFHPEPSGHHSARVGSSAAPVQEAR
ncbi:MEDS domain-containing protein [Actinoplanes sp. NPDC051346]|uniref:MEDS domain-containing protein n=1 Tax=Actinoplanes sp. NPDC051346 TaxID=3155048 RepID=UPI003416C331